MTTLEKLADAEALRWLLNKGDADDSPRMTLGTVLHSVANSKGENINTQLERLYADYKTLAAEIAQYKAEIGKLFIEREDALQRVKVLEDALCRIAACVTDGVKSREIARKALGESNE